MKKNLFFICLFLVSFIAAKAEVSKVFEAKISATPVLGYETNGETAIYAGSKNFNVVQLTDGKILLEKSYKDAGLSITKGTDAYVSAAMDKLVVCSSSSVGCIDMKTGNKLWETPSFVELDNNQALMICDDFVLVADKKAKENYVLSCLSMNDGKVIWSIENEKEKIRIENIYFVPSYPSFGIFTPKNKEKANQFRVVNLNSGKVTASMEMEGQPVYTFMDKSSGNIYLHNRVSEATSFLTAISLKDQKFLWKSKSSNKSPQTPMEMNTNTISYYATIQAFDDKVMLKTEGIEVFEASSGKALYNIPFVPYHEWGVGHYVNGIFEPVVTSNGILIADRTQGEIAIKMMDKNTGKAIWSTEKLEKKKCAPVAVVSGQSCVVQFGGLNYFEVINNGGIGKLLDPFCVTSFDLQTGKVMWNIDSKKDFYYISPSNDNIMIVGTKDLQSVNAQSGAIEKTDKNPFGEDYFMTKFTLGSVHKIQKNVAFNFSTRDVYKFEEGKLIKSTF